MIKGSWQVTLRILYVLGMTFVPVDLRKDNAAGIQPGAKYQEALLLWLRWNDAHERITSTLFRIGQDAGAVEQALDQLDQSRLEAVRLSQQLLDSNS